MADSRISIVISSDPTGAVTGLKMVGAETEKLAATTRTFTEKIKENWIGISAGITAAYLAFNKVFSLMDASAQHAEKMETLDKLTARFGMTADGLVESIGKYSHGLIGVGASANVATAAMAKGFTPDQITKMASWAATMSKVSDEGLSASESFKTLESSLASARERGVVKFMGASIDLKSSLGAQYDTMTKAQKAHELFAAVGERVSKVQRILADDFESSSDKIERYKNQIEELKLSVGDLALRVSAALLGAFQSISGSISILIGAFLKLFQASAWLTDKVGLTKGESQRWKEMSDALRMSGEDLKTKGSANVSLAFGSKRLVTPGSGESLDQDLSNGTKRQEKLTDMMRAFAEQRDLIDAAEKDKELVRLNFWFDEQAKKLRDLGAGDAEYSALVRLYALKRHEDVASQATKTADFYIAEQKRMSEEAIKIQKDQDDAMLKESIIGTETRLKVQAMGMELSGADPIALLRQKAEGEREILEIRAKALVDSITENTSFEDTLKIMWQVRDIWAQIAASKQVQAADTSKEMLKTDAAAQINVFATSGIAEHNLAIDEATAKVTAFRDVWTEAHKSVGMMAVDLGLAVRDGLVSSISDVIMGAKTAGEAFKELGKAILKMIVDTLLKWIINRTIMAGLEAMFVAQQTATTVAAATVIGAAWLEPAYLATVATLGGAAAEGVAALGLGMAAAQGLGAAMKGASMFAQGAGEADLGGGLSDAISGGTGAMYASGTDYVPQTMNALVHQGERILTPDQNKDFTEFIGGKGDSGETVNVSVGGEPIFKLIRRAARDGRLNLGGRMAGGASMRIYYENRIDEAATVLTATTEAADLPVENIADPDRNKVYRTGTSGAGEAIVIDLGSAKSVQAVILLDHTLTSGDSAIHVQGNASDSWGSPSFEDDIVFNAGTIIHHMAAVQTYQYWRIIFTKASAGVVRDIGRVFLGPYKTMTRGPQLPDGLTITPTDLFVTDRALSGKTYSDIKGQYDAITIDFPPVSDTQMEDVKAVAAAVGTHTPFFVSIDPTLEPYDLLYYVKAKSFKGRKVKMWGSGAAWDLGMDLNEEI